MGAALAIRRDLVSADDLRRLARRERNRRTATRMLGIAHALDGMSRAQAARLVGLERQALRDAVVRFNAEGLDGLRDRQKPGRPPTLSEAEQALLRARVFQRPTLEEGGGDWTLPRLCAWIESRLGKRLHPASLSRVMRGLDLSRQKTRPRHPRTEPQAQAAFAKGGSPAP
jgi:transposase